LEHILLGVKPTSKLRKTPFGPKAIAKNLCVPFEYSMFAV